MHDLKMKKLNLGCGNDVKKGWVNLDVIKMPGVDVVHDLNRTPWPFSAGEFDEVLCQDVLEHVDDLLTVLKEIHRVLKPGGIARIRVPHFTSAIAYNDPTHKRFFAWNSFEYFEKGKPYHFYVDFSFRQVSRRLEFGKKFAVWNWMIQPLANLLPRFYEDTPLRVFPAMNLHVVLRKS
jgi:SAM-dependent methyltransferase